jgi:hypothetical protein
VSACNHAQHCTSCSKWLWSTQTAFSVSMRTCLLLSCTWSTWSGTLPFVFQNSAHKTSCSCSSTPAGHPAGFTGSVLGCSTSLTDVAVQCSTLLRQCRTLPSRSPDSLAQSEMRRMQILRTDKRNAPQYCAMHQSRVLLRHPCMDIPALAHAQLEPLGQI